MSDTKNSKLLKIKSKKYLYIKLTVCLNIIFFFTFKMTIKLILLRRIKFFYNIFFLYLSEFNLIKLKEFLLKCRRYSTNLIELSNNNLKLQLLELN